MCCNQPANLLDTLKREYLSKKLFVAHLYFWWKWEYLSKNLSKKHGCLWFIFVFGGWTHRSVNICKRTMVFSCLYVTFIADILTSSVYILMEGDVAATLAYWPARGSDKDASSLAGWPAWPGTWRRGWLASWCWLISQGTWRRDWLAATLARWLALGRGGEAGSLAGAGLSRRERGGETGSLAGAGPSSRRKRRTRSVARGFFMFFLL
ncbi:hypothetical protein BDA96_04G335300 [Sorghum bicolor]|uniref:Uncharacterized protein n=2 Tax=Sorghum bicolor TaxID=4558 RepID=A0A921UMP1_SORBI|nr:uncharacterized protein LOC110430580 isoform X2 [Sorghum bicolor]KAG0515925.1 hypothetical protein BDA96_10G318900 [Sorghum bicolor]KAG0535076.1 hypothetical protein BDA96_04G335300 [Sorghum bicolor]OQU78493.1 hypothetical protein SORBI_3009G245101 [Sorghum bicolor]|eukprot:XP_021304055.1 uncharacterized protein LOC110430580 isoform X2 [Sorghum bicolor]